MFGISRLYATGMLHFGKRCSPVVQKCDYREPGPGNDMEEFNNGNDMEGFNNGNDIHGLWDTGLDDADGDADGDGDDRAGVYDDSAGNGGRAQDDGSDTGRPAGNGDRSDISYIAANADMVTNTDDPAVAAHFSVEVLSDDVIAKISGVSFRVNDRVGLDDLRLVRVIHWGFDDKIHRGELIVHKNVAHEVSDIFRELLAGNFPIEKIRLIDEYNADDDLSMADNNTSALCVRPITGSSHVFSKHSYGIAIDINPVQNPYIRDNIVLPPEGAKYTDRSLQVKGMILRGDVCYTAFKSRNWTWGGDWHYPVDHMHFEKDIF